MSNQFKFAGTFLGKRLVTYDPAIECTEDDFARFLSQFNRLETLRIICPISRQLFYDQNQILKIGEVPVREEIVHYFAYMAIKHCDENIDKCMMDWHVELALKMSHKLIDNKFSDKEYGAIEVLTKVSYNQFVFKQKNFNNFCRNYYIYTELWAKVARANEIDILNEIHKEIGLPYNYALLFAYALAGNKHGHFWLFGEKEINEINDITGYSITVEHHINFTKWCSGTFDDILNQDGVIPPFIRFPVVETKSQPLSNKGEVFMIISPQFIHDKLTSGLYFSLADRFNKGRKSNKFKELFGYVFQEYIGDLLRFYFKQWQIIPEIKYKKGNNDQDSVDWFLVKDDKLILIEVKQSSIFLGSKFDPSVESIVKDLEKTVIHAVNQLSTSEKDIISDKYFELNKFTNVRHIAKLIIINDPLFNANFIVKSLLKGKEEDLSFHVININDFETILSCQQESESLFDLLQYKTLEHNEMDFNEFLYAVYPDGRSDIEFLVPIWNRFFEKTKQPQEILKAQQ